jgi:hypothetical protein
MKQSAAGTATMTKMAATVISAIRLRTLTGLLTSIALVTVSPS